MCLTSFTVLLSGCGLWTQRAVWLITKEFIRNKEEIKPIHKHIGIWIVFLNLTGKKGGLQIAGLTLSV